MKILTPKQLDAFLRRRRVALDRAEAVARPIIEDVRRRGDRAVAEYARKFDKYDGPLMLGADALVEASANLNDRDLFLALLSAAKRIARFANLQRPKEWMKSFEPGLRAGQIVLPISSAGCYVPGGRYPLPSTVLMSAVPALISGVKHIAVACPCAPKVVMAAAFVAGVETLYPIGGVQAIAAMAYGTRSIRKADRIVGPGNVYVTAAKRIVAAETGIDFIAGPTEIVLIATGGNAKWIAADMMAQAEHDPAAVAILLTPSRNLAAAVTAEVGKKWTNCTAVTTRTIDEAIEMSNRIAPEHLWLQQSEWLNSIQNAGSIFIGPHSPVAAGDYATGPNHTLPTSGGARLRGGLSVMDFVKIVTVQTLTPKGLAKLAPAITTLARAEGLEQHARSVEIRLK